MEKFRAYARTVPVTLEGFVLSFLGIIAIRLLFEQYSSFEPGRFVVIDLPTIVHYSAFWVATMAMLMCILLYFGKTSFQEVLAVSIFGFFVVWIPPIIDLTVGGVGGHVMTYLFVPGKELLIRFLTFFGGHTDLSVTLGMQVETLFGIIFCFAYVYSATKNVLRASAAAILFYCFIFFMVAIPSVISFLLSSELPSPVVMTNLVATSNIVSNNILPGFTSTSLGLLDLGFNKLMIGLNLIMAILGTSLLFFLGTREKFWALVKNSRPERIFHFLLLFVLGIALADADWSSNLIDIGSYVLAFLAFTFAWMFCVCQNDIYDKNIDSVSNKDRPLVLENLSTADMEVASKFFLGFAILLAYAVGHYTLFFTSFFLFVYFIYSNPPLRLKRFFLLNSFLVSLACLSIIMAGFFLVSVDKAIVAFPFHLVLTILLFFTVVCNIRDIKDVEGDRADGIKTLPVLIGVKKAKKIIGGSIAIFFLLMPSYFHLSILWIPGVIASILSWYFITEEEYQEWKGFLVYMLYLIFIIGAIFLK